MTVIEVSSLRRTYRTRIRVEVHDTMLSYFEWESRRRATLEVF